MGSNFNITYISEYRVPEFVNGVHHMSFYRDGKLFVSDKEGNIVKTNQQGNELLSIRSSDPVGWGWHGFHTVTQNGDLLFIDRSTINNYIKKLPPESEDPMQFINTGDWEPLSIYASKNNRDILVGMRRGREARITKYTSTGREKQFIALNVKDENLYSYPHYITENALGYICVTDYILNAVVVVNKCGEHMFSYKYSGQPRYKPFGICTYQSDAIFVCYTRSENIHLVNHYYNQVRITSSHPIVSFQQEEGVNYPRDLCWEDENTLHVGQSNTNTVKVFTVNRQ